MAIAVEGADVVVMCMSRRYQESRNCRSEAEYTFKLNKTILPLMMEDFSPDVCLFFLLLLL